MTSPQLATRTMAASASYSTPSMVMRWIGAADVGDEPERGGDVGGHSPAALVLRERAGHDPGVVARSAGHREVLRPAGPLHPAQVERLRARAATSARAARAGEAGMRRLPASRLPVPPGNHAERDLGADQRGGRLHRGAVAAEHRDHVHPFRDAVLGERARVARAAGGQHLGAPAGAAQRAHHGLHGPRLRSAPRPGW